MLEIYNKNSNKQELIAYFLYTFKKTCNKISYSDDELETPDDFFSDIKNFLKKENFKTLWKDSMKYIEDKKLIEDILPIVLINHSIAVSFDFNGVEIIYLEDTYSKKIISEIDKIFKKQKLREPDEVRPLLNLVTMYHKQFATRSFEIQPVSIDTKIHYNDNFDRFDKKINKFLADEKSGLILLHGEMGTGKTNYIRHVINLTKDRNLEFIYFPPNMVDTIADPSFIDFISKHQGSIILLEDSEKILKKRKINESTNATSNLLNITDGLLGDCLEIRVIATFNCSKNEIDEALLRKGRLYAEYEFKKLEKNKSHILAKKIGIKNYKPGSYSLAELYNWGK